MSKRNSSKGDQDLLTSKMSNSQQPDFFSLSDEDVKEIDSFVKLIHITDNVLVINYGGYFQKQLSDLFTRISETILNSKKAQAVPELIKQITTRINSFISYKNKEHDKKALQKRFIEDSKKIRSLKNELYSHLLRLSDYSETLCSFKSQLQDLYSTITKYIIAGEKKLDQVSVILQEEDFAKNRSIHSIEEYNYIVQCYKNFSTRLDSLRVSQTSALQYIMQIDAELAKNSTLIQTISGIINNTVPAFEQMYHLS